MIELVQQRDKMVKSSFNTSSLSWHQSFLKVVFLNTFLWF